MYYAYCIQVSLCLCIASYFYATKESELQHTERTKTMNTILHKWLTYIQKVTLNKGSFTAKDTSGNPITLEWERIDGQSPKLTQKVKRFSDILAHTYTNQEIQFAQKHPERVPHEHFLKGLEPLFKDGNDKVDWKQAEKQILALFRQVFTTTDFAQFSGFQDIHFFIVAKDKENIQGLIQFLITPEYAYGTVKAGYFGIEPTAQSRGLEKVLMSSIFKILPEIQRLFLHTRPTHEKAISMYRSWGFREFQGPLPYWIDLEYCTEQCILLQKHLV